MPKKILDLKNFEWKLGLDRYIGSVVNALEVKILCLLGAPTLYLGQDTFLQRR